ncbi:MAG: hypothetical protein ACQEQW_07005 [Bacteroidota bacterium]
MKNYFMRSGSLILIMLTAIMLMNTSCDRENQDEKPELPPVESLVMDFSDFDSRPDQQKGIVETYNNFVYSYLNVVFWSSLSSGSIALPVAAYTQLLDQDADYLGDNIWQWEYNFTWDESEYTATLTAQRLNNEEFSMEMVIALSAASESGFKWFEGIVRYDHTAASWDVYKYNDMDPVKMLEVDWTKDYEAETSSLTYVYVEPGKEETGSSITMGKDASLDYNAWYTITLSTGTIEIQWDTATKEGRVRNPDHFEDNNWHCWNSELMDVECPVL